MTGPAEPAAPDYFGRVAGVRSWRLANTLWAKMGGWLWSYSMTDCWRKGVEWKEAECTLGHRIPGDDCGCGIWAFHNLPALDRELGRNVLLGNLGNQRSSFDRFEYASGVIAAGGDIIDCTDGFRAEYAKVVAIFEDGKEPSKEEIAASYGCPTISPEDYDAFCYKHRLIRLDWEYGVTVGDGYTATHTPYRHPHPIPPPIPPPPHRAYTSHILAKGDGDDGDDGSSLYPQHKRYFSGASLGYAPVHRFSA